MASGGKRIGAGKPKGYKHHRTIEKQVAAQTLEDMLRPHQADVADALVKKAKSGDTGAIKEYHERLLGKVKEKVEVDGNLHTELDLTISSALEKIYGDSPT